jgi:hypothetical protein
VSKLQNTPAAAAVSRIVAMGSNYDWSNKKILARKA